MDGWMEYNWFEGPFSAVLQGQNRFLSSKTLCGNKSANGSFVLKQRKD